MVRNQDLFWVMATELGSMRSLRPLAPWVAAHHPIGD